MHWVEMLPDTQTPSWLGLPSNAEKVLLTTQGMLQLVVFIVCILVFPRSNWIAAHPASSFCSGCYLFTGPIINHVFLYSSVLPLTLTGWPSAVEWSRSCIFASVVSEVAPSLSCVSSSYALAVYFVAVVLQKVDGCVSPHPPAAVFHSHHVALLRYYPLTTPDQDSKYPHSSHPLCSP